MMRTFSKHNLISNELGLLPMSKKNWAGRIIYSLYKKTNVEYTLSLPAPIYLRAEAFCEDICELGETFFDQRDLLIVLYDSFLYQVRKDDDVEVTYTQLMMLYELYTNKVPVKISRNDEDTHRDRFPSYRLLSEEKDLNNLVELEVSFERKHALRGEILLADMEVLFPDHPFTLEKLLEMLLFDFIEEYRKGNHKSAMKSILQNLKSNKIK